MTLPANAARALEQVKLGLAVLYGADYFTEDEWTKIGALIGIEQPKSTHGRSDHILDEPLISFVDAKHEAARDDVNVEDMNSEQDALIISERQMVPIICPKPATPAQASMENPDVFRVEPHINAKGLASLTVASSARPKSPNQTPLNDSAMEVPALSEKPTNIDEYEQATNRDLSFRRPSSRTSVAAAKPTKFSQSSAAHDIVSSKDGAALHLELTPGTILTAQSSFTQKGKVQVGVSAGDQIKVIKKVSGIMYLGENLQTKQSGQFPTSVFQKSTQACNKDFQAEKPRTVVDPKTFASVDDSSLKSSSAVLDLDKIEGMNAAEWEKDDASVATAALSLSRHELLDYEDSIHTSLADKSRESDEERVMRAMISKMVDERLQSIQKVGSKAIDSHRLPSRHSETRNTWTEPFKPIAPKTHICWFYATPNKECRFTAEECRDLHEPYSSTTDSLSLRMGKPTWGALADLSPPLSSNESVADPKGRTKTCWYWANSDCTYTAEKCRFLHEHVSEGVMPKPVDWKDKWRRQRGSDTDDGQNEAAANWAHQQRVERAWTDSSAEKYKPPHIKSREEKA